MFLPSQASSEPALVHFHDIWNGPSPRVSPGGCVKKRRPAVILLLLPRDPHRAPQPFLCPPYNSWVVLSFQPFPVPTDDAVEGSVTVASSCQLAAPWKRGFSCGFSCFWVWITLLTDRQTSKLTLALTSEQSYSQKLLHVVNGVDDWFVTDWSSLVYMN